MLIDRISLIKIALFSTLCIEITSVPLDFYIPIYGNVIGFIFLLILLLRNIKESIPALILLISISIFYFLINPNYYYNSIEPYKALVYAIIVVLFSVDLRKIDYSPILMDVFFKYLLFIVIVYFLGFGIDDAGGSLRIQGLMSEPSALSLILCYLFWSYLKLRQFKKLFFVIFVCLLTLSLVVYAQLFIFYIIYLLLEFDFKSYLRLFSIGVIIVGAIYFITKSDSDFWLIRKAADAALYTISNGDEGKNTRSVDLEKLNEEQKSNSFSYLIGNGPNYLVYYYGSRNMLTTTQNIQSILYFNYGLFGLIVGIWWIIFTLFYLRDTLYYFLFLSAISYSLINTASGIVNDIYLYSLLFLSASFLFSNRLKIALLKFSN